MQDFPHHYAVTATAAGNRVTLASPGLAEIESAGPAEFGGPGDRWSPETLLVAAVADCFVLSFRAVAAAARFAWQELECGVTGTLDREDGKLRFTHFDVRARLTLAAGADQARAAKLLQKAEASCLITNSLSATTALDMHILHASDN